MSKDINDALREFTGAASELAATLESAPEFEFTGYPGYLPSFDEFAADLASVGVRRMVLSADRGEYLPIDAEGIADWLEDWATRRFGPFEEGGFGDSWDDQNAVMSVAAMLRPHTPESVTYRCPGCAREIVAHRDSDAARTRALCDECDEAVWVITTEYADGKRDLEVLDGPPKFDHSEVEDAGAVRFEVRIANRNGGDSVVVTEWTRPRA